MTNRTKKKIKTPQSAMEYLALSDKEKIALMLQEDRARGRCYCHPGFRHCGVKTCPGLK